jgi:hypothetical protein
MKVLDHDDIQDELSGGNHADLVGEILEIPNS